MHFSSFILTFLVTAAATATSFDVNTSRRAPLACPSQNEIFEIVTKPQRPGSYEYGLQCGFEYVYTGTSANDLKCTPLTVCSYEDDDTWQCKMAGIFCDPEIVYEDDQAQCGDVCEPVNICPSQDEISEFIKDPQQPDGSFEDGLQCGFDYRYTGISANDLKCTPLTMCSYSQFDYIIGWLCAVAGTWCDPEIEYGDDDQAQCGDVCELDTICPSRDALLSEINNDHLPPGSYEDDLECDFDYVYVGSSANDLECIPLTMCSYDGDTWRCAMASIFCDPEIEYEDDQAQCGDPCAIRSCPRPNLIVDDTISDCPSGIQDWSELVGLCGTDAKDWLKHQYIDTGACPNLDVQIITANSVVTFDMKLDRVRILVDQDIYGNEIVFEEPYTG
jgi:hypothetical protein